MGPMTSTPVSANARTPEPMPETPIPPVIRSNGVSPSLFSDLSEREDSLRRVSGSFVVRRLFCHFLF